MDMPWLTSYLAINWPWDLTCTKPWWVYVLLEDQGNGTDRVCSGQHKQMDNKRLKHNSGEEQPFLGQLTTYQRTTNWQTKGGNNSQGKISGRDRLMKETIL